MSEQNALFVIEAGVRPVGEMERATLDQLEQLATQKEFTPQQKLIAQTARALAQNIDRGNTKGRAIGNEAAQLLQAIDMLTPEDDADLDPAAVPADSRELMDALASRPHLAAVPRPDRAEIRDPA